MTEIPIALAANHRYLPGLLTTMASMMHFASDRRRLVFHVFADGLEDADKEAVLSLAAEYSCEKSVKFHHPDLEPVKKLFKPYRNSHSAFLRLFLSEYLDCDWVLYSDVDTLWARDVCGIWQERDESVSVLWCKDCPSIAQGVKSYSLKWNPEFDEARYSCSGVMLMNLKRMRTTGFVLKCAEFAEKWGTPWFVDQDIINTVCRNDAKIIDQYWDLMMPDRRAADGAVIHCNGIGEFFNGEMKGVLPHYYIWYRFYYDVILKDTSRKVCPIWKRAVWFLIGRVYPSRWLVKAFTWPFALHWTDNIQRAMFFSWLIGHAEWFRSWNVGKNG